MLNLDAETSTTPVPKTSASTQVAVEKVHAHVQWEEVVPVYAEEGIDSANDPDFLLSRYFLI